MSKSKAKSRSELEYLRGTVRKLRADLRNCMKGNPVALKDEDDVVDDDTNEIICDECGKGFLSILDLGKHVYSRCLLCGVRKKL
jgi:hypothetical protein